jgi:hypothetical protein
VKASLGAWVIGAAVIALASSAAAQREPSGPHPRILWDAALGKAWRAAAALPDSPVARAIARCEQLGAAPNDFARSGYMALDWAHYLQACLVGYAAVGKDAYAATAMRYFVAMLDDLDTVGDGKGGDQAAWRDSGYAIRAMGPYTALAYDWLHDHRLMTAALRARARQRFASWTDWYAAKGYRARSPATNYHAGYLFAATFIAVAQAGEAGAAGSKLWRHVADDLWRADMTKAFAAGGMLEGGDWAEGWQYGPLSVAEYALGLRVMRRHGVVIPAAESWPVELLRRHVYALAPSDRLFVGGDTQSEQPYLEPYMFTMAAVALSDSAPAEVRGQAVAEMDRLAFRYKDFLLLDALARGTGVAAVPVPRAQWPTWYLARGTSTFYARTRWDEHAVWMAMQCSRTLAADHFHPNAGNFVISRGVDNLIVDPSPYGSLSTLTGNAPTVDSPQLPPNYRPSQGYWGELTGFRWALQSQRGVVTARCDYADQYKFQARPSDVPLAQRDWVLLPDHRGGDATLVISDRADTTSRDRELDLRFRALAPWELIGDVARVEVGASSVELSTLGAAPIKPTISSPTLKDCFGATTPRGNCNAARFPVVDVRLRLPGPEVVVTHVITVGDRTAKAARATPITDKAYRGVAISRASGEVAVLWALTSTGLRYQAAPGAVVVVHDAAAGDRVATFSATPNGAGCQLEVSSQPRAAAAKRAPPSSADERAAPLVLFLDERCQVSSDPVATTANAAVGPVEAGVAPAQQGAASAEPRPTSAEPPPRPIESPTRQVRTPRPGCCGDASPPPPLPPPLLPAADPPGGAGPRAPTALAHTSSSTSVTNHACGSASNACCSPESRGEAPRKITRSASRLTKRQAHSSSISHGLPRKRIETLAAPAR